MEIVATKNSDDFPASERPDMFQADEKFNRLSCEIAVRVCWEHKQIKDKRKLKVN